MGFLRWLSHREGLLDEEMLAVPRVGFINRHASLLPRCRGRMAAFRAHAADEPSYGVTVHFVDAGIDTGPIILLRAVAGIDMAWSYPRVMGRLCAEAPGLIWEAVDRLAAPDFEPLPNGPADAPFRFPTLGEARAYRRTLARRRGG